ncbi:hypothetical protein, partial [Nocardioides sp.]|uniref:hypothetical protein n=1 Tax=Nocardioides sp. TaxID=35761 RepID=UPI0027349A0E
MRVTARSAALFTTVLAATTLLGVPAVADPESYSSGITITVGANEQSRVPVTLDLPAPGGASRVAQVTFTWRQVAPTAAGTTHLERLSVPTPDCVAEQPCQVQVSLPTSRWVNGSNDPIWLSVSDGSQALGSRSLTIIVNNPKPSGVFTEPSTSSTTAWGSVTLAADAAPGVNGAAVKGVRFYPRGTGRESDPFLFDDTAPYTVQVPAEDIASPGGTGQVYAIAEDVEGNLTPVPGTSLDRPMVRSIRIGPPPEVGFWTPVVDSIPAGSTTNPPLLGWDAQVPDIVPDLPFGEPHIKRVQVLIDGAPWLDMPYDKVAWYNKVAKPRRISFSLF